MWCSAQKQHTSPPLELVTWLPHPITGGQEANPYCVPRTQRVEKLISSINDYHTVSGWTPQKQTLGWGFMWKWLIRKCCQQKTNMGVGKRALEEKEAKQAFDIKQNPKQGNLGSTPWGFWRQSYLRAVWTRSTESGVLILLPQESFARALLGELEIPGTSGSPCQCCLLEVKAQPENGRGIWKHTGGALTSSATPPPHQAHKSLHPAGSISQVVPKLSRCSRPLFAPSLSYPSSLPSLTFCSTALRILICNPDISNPVFQL